MAKELRNKKALGFGGILMVGVLLLFVSHFVIAQDNLAATITQQEYIETQCPPACATGSNLNINTGNTEAELETVTSFDNIIDQTGDETQSPLFPKSESIKLIADITKIDSNGNEVTERVTIEVPSLSVILDPESGADFSEGFIRVEMFAESEPLTQLDGFGRVNFRSEQTLLEQFSITFVGRTNNDGIILVNQGTPLVFSFAEHLDEFPNGRVSTLFITIEGLQITKIPDQKFALQNSVLYQTDFFKSDLVTKITDEMGGDSIVFPIDDNLKICAQNNVDANTNATIPHPPMGSVELLNQDGTTTTIFQGVTEGVGGDSTCTFTDIARNSFYQLEFTDPIKITNFTTPFSQKNYYFSCYYTDETKAARVCNLDP